MANEQAKYKTNHFAAELTSATQRKEVARGELTKAIDNFSDASAAEASARIELAKSIDSERFDRPPLGADQCLTQAKAS